MSVSNWIRLGHGWLQFVLLFNSTLNKQLLMTTYAIYCATIDLLRQLLLVVRTVAALILTASINQNQIP